MRTPTGLRTESVRSPFASRAGALHSHIHIHSQSHETGPKAPSITSGRGGARLMDGGCAETDGQR